MNSKEFEILNEKMTMVFEALQNLRRDIDHRNQEMKERELTLKAEDAQQELRWARENRDRIERYYNDISSNFYNIERNVNDRYEYRMRAAAERGLNMHAPVGPMEEKI